MTSTRRRRPTISSEWRHEPGRLVRELQFRDYDCALRFANLIGGIDDFGHHAEICVMHGAGGRLRTTVRNLNNAGITEQELRLASKLDAAIGEHYEWSYGGRLTTPPSIERVEHAAPQLTIV